MPSPIETPAESVSGSGSLLGNAKVTPEAFAMALLIASSFQIMENLLPRIPLFPWMRVGVSYVIILPFLLQFGPRAAFALFLARNFISILYGGQPLTTFLIGSGSGVIAFLGVGHPVAWAFRRGWIGILGASVTLATAFNLTQLAAVNLTLIRHAGFYFQTGPILAWSLVSGGAVALLIRFSYRELAVLFASTWESGSGKPAPGAEGSDALLAKDRDVAGRDIHISFLSGLVLMAALFVFPTIWMQLPVLAALLVAIPGRFRLLGQTWPFFFYLAWLHLFHTPGEYLIGDWVTREGGEQFARYAVRLANLILLGRWLTRRFPWGWMGGSRSNYLQGILLSLPLLPDLFGHSMMLGREILRGLAAGNRKGVLAPAFEAWRGRMSASARGARAEDAPMAGNPGRTES